MYTKIEITGTLEVVTGMHIGGSSQFAAIGAIDSPVITDSYTRQPMIPGSSIKGKMRTLLARAKADSIMLPNHDEDDEVILRLFGTAKKGSNNKTLQGRLIFSDMFWSNKDELKSIRINNPTEVKFENTINRATAVANPRQIERVIRGTKFEFRLIYDATNIDQIEEDFETIREGLRLLEYDYLGGHGSRGYGKVKFEDLEAEAVVGDIEEAVIDRCNDILKEV